MALDETTQGLVHISEITYGYVKDVHEFIKVGDEITVKVLEVDDLQKKISLSIRVLQESPVSRKKELTPRKTLQQRVDEVDADGFKILEDKLSEWIKQHREDSERANAGSKGRSIGERTQGREVEIIGIQHND